MLLVEVTEMLCLLRGSVCDACGRESGWIPETYAWGRIGLL